MAPQRSLLSDYISVILRTIEKTQNDPAQLRSLVYELARLSLGKQILAHYNQMGGAGLQKHMLGLEAAINEVEVHAMQNPQLLAPPGDGQVIGSDQSRDPAALVVHDGLDEASTSDLVHNSTALLIHDDLNRYDSPLRPVFWNSVQTWEPAQTIDALPQRVLSKFWLTMQFAAAAALGFALYVGIAGRAEVSDTLHRLHLEPLAQLLRPQPALQNTEESQAAGAASARPALPKQNLGFDLPTAYGVYAVSSGKLFELDTLPIKIPDPRIAISAIITKPSAVTVPSGKVAFVVFRRDLVSSAPDSVSVRVVARVMKEMKFSADGPATTSKINDQWAIRNNAYAFNVAPVNGNQEMILIRPSNADQTLPPGRYALPLKGQAYDLTVAGPIKDSAQCLERTNALTGSVYSECAP